MLSSTAESFQGLSKAFRSIAPSADIAIRYFFEFEQTDLDAHDLDPRVLVTAGLIRGCNGWPHPRLQRLAFPQDDMKKLRTRVVVVLGYDRNMKRIALQAWDAGMLGKGWAWVGSSDVLASERATLDNMPGGNQRVSDAQQALSGFLYFTLDIPSDPVFSDSVKNRTTADFGVPVPANAQLHSNAASMYDGIMLWAKACSNLTLDEMKGNPKNVVFERMKTVQFHGKSGFVRLDANGDTIPAAFAIINYVRTTRFNGTASLYSMQSNVVAKYVTASKNFSRTQLPIVWPGNTSVQPGDRGASHRLTLPPPSPPPSRPKPCPAALARTRLGACARTACSQ